MRDRRFQQGQRVTWKDASGQRYRGHVAHYQPARIDATTGARHEAEVVVIIEGTSHVSILPPNALGSEQGAAAAGSGD